MKCLMLGCGKTRNRNVYFADGKQDFIDDDLTTIDMDPASTPDILMELDGLPKGEKLPFDDETFDELHAYDVLEHIGKLGDWRGYFTEFAEYHRILKPGGLFFITVPIGDNLIADPGHTRFFHQNHFWFLSQDFYNRPQNLGTNATDYRWFWKKDFVIDFMQTAEDHHLAVILKRV